VDSSVEVCALSSLQCFETVGCMTGKLHGLLKACDNCTQKSFNETSGRRKTVIMEAVFNDDIGFEHLSYGWVWSCHTVVK